MICSSVNREGRIAPPETSFLIRADRTIQFQQFIDVADMPKQLNFTRVATQTQNATK